MKRPKNWYSKEAKEQRRAERDARCAEKMQRINEARNRAKTDSAAARRHLSDSRSKHDQFARELEKQLRPISVDDNPYQRRQFRKHSFVEMCDKKKVLPEMLQAAEEIDKIWTALTSGLWMKGMRMELAGATTPGPVTLRMPEHIRDIFKSRYKPWADHLSSEKKAGGDPALEVVIDVVIDRRFCTHIDTERRWRRGRADLLVRRSLLLYAEMAGWAARGAVEDFDRVHKEGRAAA